MKIVLIILGVLALIAILIYNSLIGKKNQVENIFAGVDAVLKKRFDLIPNLVASVSQYMEHEKSTLEKVTELRAQAMKPGISDDQKSHLMPNSLQRWVLLTLRWKPIPISKQTKTLCIFNALSMR